MALSRRLQQAGALGDLKTVYVPPEERDRLCYNEARKTLRLANGDCSFVLNAFSDDRMTRGHLGRYLDQLPSAESAIKVYLSAGAFHNLDDRWTLSMPCAACMDLSSAAGFAQASNRFLLFVLLRHKAGSRHNSALRFFLPDNQLSSIGLACLDLLAGWVYAL